MHSWFEPFLKTTREEQTAESVDSTFLWKFPDVRVRGGGVKTRLDEKYLYKRGVSFQGGIMCLYICVRTWESPKNQRGSGVNLELSQ